MSSKIVLSQMFIVMIGQEDLGASASAKFLERSEEVVSEILTWGQKQVKIINGPIPGICGADISFSASRE